MKNYINEIWYSYLVVMFCILHRVNEMWVGVVKGLEIQ